MPAPRPRRLLALGAHPDDIEFGCGGVLLAEAARGSEIALAVASRGEAASHGTPAERTAEAQAAADLLGASLQFLDLGGDCHLACTPSAALVLAQLLRQLKPDILLAPTTFSSQHPDHIVLGQLAESAARLARYGGLAELEKLPPHSVAHHFRYAITPAAEPREQGPRLRVDISPHFQRWVELMECHQSQLRTRHYIELQTARARALGVEAGVEYAQALYVTDDFLVETLGDLPSSVRLF